ncbi:putative DNA polymerase epsilon subunit A [Heterostelium album PN500]|uniref:DNA polymerase epsilon catalytic subunit n=1 Tax=Heterostelium pallidum (strain ATCC 26659 / Pp 5 / PN500) TaxID=670386 RepID=D3BMV7_HETP5|nr:putative DNA polymerase epsilon subunit A [Heterostelium album PN500]EFA77319.1 putative DNA polymerase epsilon subunit A [Heterostelium album PN500]|eukprot:XP_020429448.1 putative DNA polymerase epsilon subunit A [Heterostelium album PN500]
MGGGYQKRNTTGTANQMMGQGRGGRSGSGGYRRNTYNNNSNNNNNNNNNSNNNNYNSNNNYRKSNNKSYYNKVNRDDDNDNTTTGGGGGGQVTSTNKFKVNKRWDNDDIEDSGDEDNNEVIDNDIEDVSSHTNHTDKDDRDQFQPLRTGWLLNMKPSSSKDKESGVDRASIELFFIQEDATSFRAWVIYNPYFYIYVKDNHHTEVETYLKRQYENKIAGIDLIDKEDLDLENHLSGIKKKYLKIRFHNVQTLLEIRSDILPLVKRNKLRQSTTEAYEDPFAAYSVVSRSDRKSAHSKQATEYILDIREYDVTYYQRAAIDLEIRVGLWYEVKRDSPTAPTTVRHLLEREERPDPKVLAFDIETTHLPQKFPDPEIDSIMMISYMLDRQGFLIVNREIVAADIDDFEYTPKPEYEGPFTVFNEPDERATLERFFSHIRELRPHIFVTYHGDGFDWPFVDARTKHHGMDLYREIGFRKTVDEDYRGQTAVHMDAFCWVKRDSYLPHGSHRLKEVVRKKLRYNPLELDPEEMVRSAREDPERLANYSVSDAVATYYLYMSYIHPFIFSLCNIIPLNPDDVLRKGSGSLCEALLMTQAFRANVIFPNKHIDEQRKIYKGHLVESETYVGGHVECLESGIFRSDIPTHFSLDAEAIQTHIDAVDNIIQQAMKETGVSDDDLTNFQQIKDDIVARLTGLRENPKQQSKPLIYHLDVSAMYPNIILTNRLQPTSIVTDEFCATCDFNKPESNCQRTLNWEWRGDYSPSNFSEYRLILQQLESERFGPEEKPFSEHTEEEQNIMLRKRLKEYSKKVYKKTHIISNEIKSDTVCMRENSFYVDTVKLFRDRRYVYKDLHGQWKGHLDSAQKGSSSHDLGKCQNMVIMYESMQLAHKCILNSFYGYVMRKGSRWYSMQMAGIVTHTGSNIIKNARIAVEQLGRPLELDTDGIWCILPESFPEEYSLKLKNGKSKKFNFLNALLNARVAELYTNHQYQELGPNGEYITRSECSIQFESDGPYGCMFIPTGKEKDVKLKKRYAVFNKQGGVQELKGFEIKRRGELELIKTFQTELFQCFLQGNTLETCYHAIAAVANHWLDVLDSHADGYDEKELIRLITESSKMSKKLEEYDRQKSTAIGTAFKLKEFLGPEIVKDAGLQCQYIIANKPAGAPVTERTIPTEIFAADEEVRVMFLRKWTKGKDVGLRDIIDWDYYRQRLSGVIQKMITLPAALQNVENPVPRVLHPDWILKELKRQNDSRQQTQITSFFNKVDKAQHMDDIEDMFKDKFQDAASKPPMFTKHKRTGATTASDLAANKKKRHQEEQLIGECPKYEVDFDGWLKHKKVHWRKLRSRIKAKKTGKEVDFDELKTVQSNSAKSFNGFFTSQNEAVRKGVWHIISIDPTNHPGFYTFWSLIGDQLIPIKVELQRHFYLNSFQRDPYDGANPVVSNAVPPRSKPRLHLTQHSMSEDEFIKNSKELSTLFTLPQIEGVYETQTPLDISAIVQIGCMASLRRNAKPNANGRYPLDSIQSRGSDRSSSYMSEANFHQIYLYHNSKDGKDGIFAVINFHSKQGTIIFVNPYQSHSISKKLLNSLGEKYPSITFNFKIDTSMENGRRSVNKMLEEYQSERKGATILVTQVVNIVEMYHDIPLLREFAKVQMISHEYDSQYSPFNWEVHALKPLLTRIGEVDNYIKYFTGLARYANIPIGNLKGDYASFVSDVCYSRMLKESNHLLWMSLSNCPDLGGSEEDDAKFHEELGKTEINQPGCYNSACFELNIGGLAVNTILESSHLADIEGIIGGQLNNGDSETLNFDNSVDKQPNYEKIVKTSAAMEQFNSCDKEFNILRKMVTRWSLDLVMGNRRNNPTPDLLLTHFYRWISSPYSGMYDPIIHRTLHGLMKKVFLQLIFEFKKLGCKVIYGNFNRIILCSQKTSIEDAKQYCSYIITVIKKKELFSWITIKPTKFWNNLLWMDVSNFGGVYQQPPSQDQNNKVSPDTTSNQTTDLISHWNLSEFLPPSIQNSFLLVISDFIHKLYIHNEKQRIQNILQPKTTPINNNNNNDNNNDNDKQDEDENNNNNNNNNADKNILRNSNSNWNEDDEEEEDKLLPYKFNSVVDNNRIVQILQGLKYSENTDEFPTLPGSHLHFTNPALEFVKSVCHVLMLDQSLHNQVQRLRKNLMRIINIREFSEEAVFKDPCLSYVMSDVICSYCYSCRDIDLLRDNATNNKLVCAQCGNNYNKGQIESVLVETVQRRSLSYHLQDLKCSKCAQIKIDNLSDICHTCSGQYQCREPSSTLQKELIIFGNIAKFYEFVWLQEIVEGLVKWS